MKVITWALSLLVGLMICSATGCPTCVGRMKINDEPFFSDAFYNKITLPHTRSRQQLIDEDINNIEDAEDNGDDEDDLGVSS